MDGLPVEIFETILEYVLWDDLDEEFYRLLRAVSHTWKSAVEKAHSRIFNYWYNRCKKEIPEDHLLDIVQAKYPLFAHPWQKFYWVNSRRPHVAKNVYKIWQSFPKVEELDATNIKINWPLEDIEVFHERIISAGMNDKYFAVSCYNEEYGGSWSTVIYEWDDLQDPIMVYYPLKSDKIDFYTTEKGTFVIIKAHDEDEDDDESDDESDDSYYEISISKYPIDNLPITLIPREASELTFLDCNKEYCITQNECFYITNNDSQQPRILKHKILTERGFETNAVIEPPVGMPKLSWQRVEICGCTLYVVQRGPEKLSFAKYNISRNSDGKLSFTLDEWKILDRNERVKSVLYSKIDSLFLFDIFGRNLCLTSDFEFNLAKFDPWLSRVYGENIRALAAHVNYVFCPEKKSGTPTRISIFEKKDLTEHMEANDPDHLKRSFIYNIEYKEDEEDLDHLESTINWIGIIYIGLKARILVQYDDFFLSLINFY